MEALRRSTPSRLAGGNRSGASTWVPPTASCSASMAAGGRRQAAAGPSFVHGGPEPFPVWWTAPAATRAVITGWVGGPRAAALAGRGEAAMLRLALESLASVFGRDVGELRSRLRMAYVHDWSADPFSGGAYSYGGVGAIEARAALDAPSRRTRSTWPARPSPSRAGTPPCTARSTAEGRRPPLSRPGTRPQARMEPAGPRRRFYQDSCSTVFRSAG